MFDESLVTIIFRILNFAALIGLAYYIFNKYFKKEISESIENDRLEEINLNTRINELEGRGSELSHEIIQQEKLCAHLTSRTDEWKSAFEHDIKAKRLDQQAQNEKTAERALKQANSITQERMRQALLPIALAQAQHRLARSFNTQESGHEFIQKIVDFMKKS